MVSAKDECRGGFGERVWACRSCSVESHGINFLVQCARSLPDRVEFRYGECTFCGSLTLLDDVDPSPWYRDGYERLTPGVAPPGGTRAIRAIGALGRGVAHISVMPRAHIPPKPTWAAELRGMRLGRESRILDVGCGRGGFLLHLARFGFTHLEGIDPYLPEPEIRFGPVVLSRRDLEDVSDTFDGIYFQHSLEHVDEPGELLRLAAERLSPGGRIVVSLPIAGGRAWRRFRDNWIGLDAPLHRWVPTPEGMHLLAQNSGLTVVRWRGDTIPLYYTYSTLIQSGQQPFQAGQAALDQRQLSWCAKQARRERGLDAASGTFVLEKG